MAKIRPVKITVRTPIEPLKQSPLPLKVYVKRDDLNGLLISGNKARKLEYLAADARSKNCDTLITCGPVQSNHCRTTAVVAQMLGLDCHLLLRTRTDDEPTGNLLLDELMGAKIKFISPEQYRRRIELMAEYAETLKGKKPYLIPEGGSNAIGSLGYIDCMKEMAGFIRKNAIEAVYCAVGSGGTYAGLLLGKKLLKLGCDLNGIIVCDTVEYFTAKIMDICQDAVQRFKLKVKMNKGDISLVDGYVGEGYGIPYPEELQAIRTWAKRGIVLEPVYTGKAFYGMLKDLEKREYKKVIFVHTGGIFSIFAFGKELMRLSGDRDIRLRFSGDQKTS